ncbi:hypothetical protein BH23BAC1_BH23BAC1_20690 [soil metagenome]
MKLNFLIILIITISFSALAQHPAPPPGVIQKGIKFIDPDSAFSIDFRFRMQNRAVFNAVTLGSPEISEIEARVRRLRLRMEGFMYSPKLTYMVQLSFSRGDMDWSVRHNSQVNESPNVVRDAAIYYRPNQRFQFIFGQTKLPGNRQRVISSGEQQFVDRSIVNALFNIDRDFGFQVYYFNNTRNFHYILKGALTTGDGRNVTLTNAGLSYTGRVEVYPLGNFTNYGDTFEGDLEREQTVKIALAGGLSYNDKARRTGGQIGGDLFEMRDITTFIFDGLLKYRGYSLYVEYMQRNSNNPFTTAPGGELRHVITGNGKLFQNAYLFSNNFEIAARYANIRPGDLLTELEANEDVYTAGVTKYLRRHRLKVQGNVSFHNLNGVVMEQNSAFWSGAFQVELGI